MNELSVLLDKLNRRGYHVSWTQTLDVPGVLVRQHELLVLAADRSNEVLVSAVTDALDKIARPEQASA